MVICELLDAINARKTQENDKQIKLNSVSNKTHMAEMTLKEKFSVMLIFIYKDETSLKFLFPRQAEGKRACVIFSFSMLLVLNSLRQT